MSAHILRMEIKAANKRNDSECVAKSLVCALHILISCAIYGHAVSYHTRHATDLSFQLDCFQRESSLEDNQNG